jgi:hypothetical protein
MGEVRMFSILVNNIKKIATIGPLCSLFFTISCGSVNPDPAPGSGKGTVALFITDNISFYQQVISTITGVRLINSGTGTVCEILKAPVTLDIANLASVAHYVDLAECPAGSYNRIDVDVLADVRLMNQLGNPSSCAFKSFIQQNGDVTPLSCDAATGICTLTVPGGERGRTVLVQEDQYNDLGIDFGLKQFLVANFGNPSACAVTMAVYPVSAVEMNSSGRAHSVTGGISDLNAAIDTFILTAGTTTLQVDYSGINPALQKNIDMLLTTAQTEGLLVNVLTGRVALDTGTIAANRIFIKAPGTVSSVQPEPQWTFSLEHQPGKIMAGSHKPPAAVQGDFVDGTWVNVKFDGYDEITSEYLAASVEVLPAGTVLAD